MSILASCATPSARLTPVEAPRPAAPDPALCAPVRKTPDPPPGASIVAPASIEEQTATSLFLTWVADLVDVARDNEQRAVKAQAPCRR